MSRKKLIVVIPTAPNGSIDARLVEWMFIVSGDKIPGWTVQCVICREQPVVAARNRLVKHFLSTDGDVMLTIDSDQVPQLTEGDDNGGLGLLLEAIERDDVDIVNAITVRNTKDGPLPVINRMTGPVKAELHAEILQRKQGLHELGPDGVMGGAGIMVKRHVLQAFQDKEVLWFWDVFVEKQGKMRCEDTGKDLWGERLVGHDVWFFLQAHELGFRSWVDTRVFWGHVKTQDIRKEFNRDIELLTQIDNLKRKAVAV